MKKSILVLTTSAACALCLAFFSGAQADTTTPSTAAPAAKKAPAAPGTDARAIIRPGDPAKTSIPTDPDQRKSEANFRAAIEKCNAIVAKDSKTKCLDEAETNFANGKP